MGERLNILSFLKEYQKLPCLWKKSCPDFKNREKRVQAEGILLPLSGLSTVKELRQKIKSIRGTYNQEISKIRKSVRSGCEDVYKPKLVWFAFADSFLRQNLEDNDSDSNLTLPEHLSGDTSGEEDPIAKNERPSQEPAISEVNQHVPPINPVNAHICHKRKVYSIRHTQMKKRKKESLNNVAEALKLATEQITPQAKNEFETFGEHVSAQLQCLELEEAITLQGEIQKLITAARLRCLRSNTEKVYLSNGSNRIFIGDETCQPPNERCSEDPDPLINSSFTGSDLKILHVKTEN